MLEALHIIVLSLHVLGAAIIIGGVFASLLILVKDRIPRDSLEFVQYLWKFLTPAIGAQILTGIYLASRDWNDFGGNPIFWIKMGLLVVDGFFGGRILGEKIKDSLSKKTKDTKIPGAKLIIWKSFLTFLIIATLGVFLAEMHE